MQVMQPQTICKTTCITCITKTFFWPTMPPSFISLFTQANALPHLKRAKLPSWRLHHQAAEPDIECASALVPPIPLLRNQQFRNRGAKSSVWEGPKPCSVVRCQWKQQGCFEGAIQQFRNCTKSSVGGPRRLDREEEVECAAMMAWRCHGGALKSCESATWQSRSRTKSWEAAERAACIGTMGLELPWTRSGYWRVPFGSVETLQRAL